MKLVCDDRVNEELNLRILLKLDDIGFGEVFITKSTNWLLLLNDAENNSFK